jgi:hypothetical protein
MRPAADCHGKAAESGVGRFFFFRVTSAAAALIYRVGRTRPPEQP